MMINQPAIILDVLPAEALRAYCQKWKIRELAVFGSVLREDFDDDSDVDVMVTFEEATHHTLFDLVHMAEELEAIAGRRVDLLTRHAVDASPNYIRRREILSTSQVIYAR
jgi:hypothetical protein